ncbi:hypothetical protein LRAMOSA11106 [Lichtheimia ramosa]|uniref:Heterokaryon incompatibility domain-containing protein n=1 Tax=Lichtheimia ramosa TaxID=688394 RepID=A0A077WTH3_9FUNG|nr:hypothetical protein LRAMOSA11106 [Lichtheimia ramosa]
MTCDNNDQNTDDKVDKHNQFFEKGLNALLSDKHFLLLYVPDNEAMMQIIRPASNVYHRKRMIKRMKEAKPIPSFYYALSHLWGITEDNRHLWHEIGKYVEDEKGQPAAPVSMRPEKRDTLLALLKDHPDSYWWIDVLCARTDTPLDIMGDIYACCLECIAMIDCDPTLIPTLYTSKTTVKEKFIDFWANLDRSPDEILHYKQVKERNPQLLSRLITLMKSNWWQRVWTWQEMALPFGQVRFMAETNTQRLERNTITVDELLNSCMNAAYIMYYIYFKCDTETYGEDMSSLFDWLCEITQARAFSKHRIEKKKTVDQFDSLVTSLGLSTRRCMDPVDYVYGVLGMFQFKIPRMKDPKEVWQRFLIELDNYMVTNAIKNTPTGWRITGINERAYAVDLRKAKHMADVYNDLLKASLSQEYHMNRRANLIK